DFRAASMRGLAPLLAAFVVLAGGIPAFAANQAACFDQNGPAQTAISACNQIIASGKLIGRDLASIYNGRGNRYYGNREYDRAVADYNEAIRLDPPNAVLYNNRGSSYYSKGDCDRALPDYSEAIRLNSGYALAY